ncbi:hypothetical protein J6590_033006 [Homalodisca vitripennis]|nr:hypothetical protein J6590_033006 [Homalodisca vitripennis]
MPPAAKRPHHGGGLLFPLHPLALPPAHLLPPDYSHYPPLHPGQREGDERRTHGEDEWKNIHVMLNCILSMVEKTKRALSILQQRAGENGHVSSNEWLPRRDALRTSAPSHSAEDVKRTAGELMAQTIRLTEDRVAEVRRKAEEAVNEVKRQAVAELQRAVAAAETKACELVAAERAKMEKLVAEARKQAVEEVVAGSGGAGAVAGTAPTERSDSPPTPSQQNSCWNCGRKANETCSGCNTARYCGAFCQHKDWETHHAVCCARSDKRPVLTPRAATPAEASNK